VLAAHVHLPVQSGSDRVLRRMIRRYTRAEYLERVQRLWTARPGLSFSTDVIVGFPGETEDDFRATLSLVKEVGFTSLFGFKFSPRPYTPALRLVDDIREEEKSERLARLFELAEAQGRAHLASLVGTRQSVLVEGESAGADGVPVASGRTERNEIVHLPIPVGRALVGQLVWVEVERANKHSLFGRLPHEALASLPTVARTAAEARRTLPLAP
jgi:tRNA-2-methylthio-N6-dimethylallyladenosine synthase